MKKDMLLPSPAPPLRFLFLCGLLCCLLLAGCSSQKEPQAEAAEISTADLAAANDLDALCTQYGAVTYQLKSISEEDNSTSWCTYWKQDGELVCAMTSNLEGNYDIYSTPDADFSSREGLTYVSCPVPDAGVSNTPTPPYPNGFLTDPKAQETLTDCQKTKTGYMFTFTSSYDKTSSTESTFTTDQDLVITGCQSVSKGANYQEASTLSVAFYETPLPPPDYATADPVTLTLVSITDGVENASEITIPRGCLLSVYGTESTVVSWDAFATQFLEEDITVADDLTLYAIDRSNFPVG